MKKAEEFNYCLILKNISMTVYQRMRINLTQNKISPFTPSKVKDTVAIIKPGIRTISNRLMTFCTETKEMNCFIVFNFVKGEKFSTDFNNPELVFLIVSNHWIRTIPDCRGVGP